MKWIWRENRNGGGCYKEGMDEGVWVWVKTNLKYRLEHGLLAGPLLGRNGYGFMYKKLLSRGGADGYIKIA